MSLTRMGIYIQVKRTLLYAFNLKSFKMNVSV